MCHSVTPTHENQLEICGTATALRGLLKELLKQSFDYIYTFERIPMQHVSSNVVSIELPDPSITMPWSKEDMLLFHEHAQHIATHLRENQRVLILCKGGKNRSAAMARAALMLAHMSTDTIPIPVDPTLEGFSKSIVDGTFADMSVFPCTVHRAKRHRPSCSD